MQCFCGAARWLSSVACGRVRGRGAAGAAGAAAAAARAAARLLLTGAAAEQRLTLVLRADLGMGKGKLCAQASHGALAAYRAAQASGDAARLAALAAWERSGQAKVVLRAEGEAQLLALRQACDERGLPCALIRDAGRTQVPCGAVTCLAIGPAPAEAISEVTGELRLL